MPLLYTSFLGGGGGGGGGATDPYFANVVLLCGFDGTDGATSATDDSNSAHALTFVGNAQIDTAQSKFGGASLLLDGSGDRVTVPDSLDWQLGSTNSSPWTVECWVRWNVLNADNRGIMGQNASSGWYFSGSSTIGELTFASANFTPIVTSGAGMTTAVWYHLAVDHDTSGKIRIYVDGVMRGSATPANSAIGNYAWPLAIGAQGDAGQVDMNGWIDELRITKGVARYASDGGFTPPDAAFPRS